MRRIGHGDVGSIRPRRGMNGGASLFRRSVILAEQPRESSFNYMFPELQADEANLLPATPVMIDALKALADVMTDSGEQAPTGGVKGPGDSDIPAAYTYLGQFLDHDITFDQNSASLETLARPDFTPLASLGGLVNGRSARLDLDSVYGGPRDLTAPARMLVGKVTSLNGTESPLLRPVGKSDRNDLPRQPRDDDPAEDRAAMIGDPRNDENLIVAQLHTAFLKAHNSLVDEGLTYEQACRKIRRSYQSLILNDFLTRICDPGVLDDVLRNGPSAWRLGAYAPLFMPVEFSVAAYRFGHSMIRTLYDFNLNFEDAGLDRLFTFTALSGQLGEDVGLPPSDTLPDNWIIEWERFLPIGARPPQMARTIDTRLTDFTFRLQDTFGRPEGVDAPAGSELQRIAPRLAMRNLLRGLLFRLPTGQAVARRMGLAPLEGAALLAALPRAQRAAATPFQTATPLWFYVLAEAGDPNGPNGDHLGPVGSRIVAETIWTLIRRSEDSILAPTDHGYASSEPPFTLADLIALAARQDAPAPALS